MMKDNYMDHQINNGQNFNLATRIKDFPVIFSQVMVIAIAEKHVLGKSACNHRKPSRKICSI